jgi:hypothetical protein
MALIALTDTNSGASFSLDQADIIKIYDKDSQTVVEYASGELSRNLTKKVDGAVATVAALASNVFSTTYLGGTIYLNSDRIVSVEEVSSKAWVTYDNNGENPELLKLDVDKSTFEAAVPTTQSLNGYKEYIALLTQTGTSAPTAVVIKNELSGTVVWSYANVGVYDGTLVGEFLDDTTGVFIMTAGPSTVSGGRNNDDKVRLRIVDDAGVGQDAKLTDSMIRIVVKI